MAAKFDTWLVVGITLLISVAPLLPVAAVIGTTVGLASLTLLALFRRYRVAAPLAIFCTIALALALAGVPYSQLILGLSLLFQAAVVRTVPWLRRGAAWARRGVLNYEVGLLTAAAALIAAITLLGWFIIFTPDVQDLVETFVPDLPIGLLIVGGLAFSMINAAVEEAAYRGVLMHALETSLGPGPMALGLQAVAFGTFHINGFPRGWIGVGLACIYGVVLGVIRRRAGGMLAPFVAHVFTDIAIAVMLVVYARAF